MLHNFHGGAKYLETEKQKKSGKSRLSSMNLPEMTKRKDLRKPQDLFLSGEISPGWYKQRKIRSSLGIR